MTKTAGTRLRTRIMKKGASACIALALVAGMAPVGAANALDAKDAAVRAACEEPAQAGGLSLEDYGFPESAAALLEGYPRALWEAVAQCRDGGLGAAEALDLATQLKEEGLISSEDCRSFCDLVESGALGCVLTSAEEDAEAAADAGDEPTGGLGDSVDLPEESAVPEPLPDQGSAQGEDSPAPPSSSAGAVSDADAPSAGRTQGSPAPESAAGGGKGVEAVPSSGSYQAVRTYPSMTTTKFIAAIGEQAREVGQENGLYASVIIAQAVLETGSGSSTLSKAPNYNFFGVKGKWRGKSVVMPTTEDGRAGTPSTELAEFRRYDSFMDSLEDYAQLVRGDMASLYSGMWRENAPTYIEACDHLQDRYATDESYSAKLQAIIEGYGLTRYDEPLPYELDGEYLVPELDDEGEQVFDEDGEPAMEQRGLADLLAEATSHLGTEYVWGGASPQTGLDCSGLVQYSYREALGVELPRTSQEQWRVGEVVQFDDLHPGDLLFFETDGDVGHVAMYLGEGCYIHAPQTGDVVKVTAMEEHEPSFAVRVLPTHDVDEASEAGRGDAAVPMDRAEFAVYMNFLGL